MGETFALRRCKKEAKCGQSEHEPDRKAESISLSFPVKPEMRKKAEAQGGYDLLLITGRNVALQGFLKNNGLRKESLENQLRNPPRQVNALQY
jgi:hypothetical protein